MAKLETLVVQEIWETETAAFWRRPGVDPKSIQTEVILLPAAFFMEKNGTISNSGGMVQWRHAAVKPPGQAKPDGEIVDYVFRAVRDLVKDSTEPRDEIIRKAFWTYTTAEDVLREINGYALRDNPETGAQERRSRAARSAISRRRLDLVRRLDLRGRLRRRREPLEAPRLEDGSRRPRPLSGLRVDLAEQHAHPLQPRVVRSERQALPGLEAHRLVGRAGEALDGIRRAGRPRRDRRARHAERPARLPPGRGGRRPPLRGRVPSGPRPRGTPIIWRDVAYVPKDGPLPEMYEPVESPVENVLHPSVKSNPMLKYPRVASHQPIGTADKFPYVLMTSTVAEHWCAGSTTRNIPWLNELVPEPVLELPVALATEARGEIGDWVRVSSARGELEVKALVTPAHEGAENRRPRGHRRLDAVQLGLPGAVDRPERQPPHDRRLGSRSGNPGDQGVPRQRGQGRPPGSARSGAPRGRT